MTEDQTDPTLGPDGTDAVDLDPTGCPYTWTPGADTPLGRRFDRVRCTRPLHHDGNHQWDMREQQERTARVKGHLLDALEPSHLQTALTKPLEARTVTPITLTDDHVDDRAERIIGRHLSRLAKKGTAHWAEDDTAIGGQAANITRQLREAGLLA